MFSIMQHQHIHHTIATTAAGKIGKHRKLPHWHNQNLTFHNISCICPCAPGIKLETKSGQTDPNSIPFDHTQNRMTCSTCCQQVVAPGWTDHGHLVVTILEKCRQEIWTYVAYVKSMWNILIPYHMLLNLLKLLHLVDMYINCILYIYIY